jgi:hypothetical protein
LTISKKELKMNLNFESSFVNWLNTSLSEDIPSDVEAFCFNLYQPAGYDNVEYGIELIGASRFDKLDEDWACDDMWEPKQREMLIPVEFSTNDWEVCQSKLKNLIQEYLNSTNTNVDVLKQHKAIAIGFVDGNLDLIWVAKSK